VRLILLGDPVDHSRSPAIHTAALRAVGIEGTYESRRSDDAGVIAAVAEMRSGALDGANVTMPLKGRALEAADSASVDAIRAGAVNTLIVRHGSVSGENTDVGGIRDASDRRNLPTGVPVLILGAGGAAGAAVLAFEGRRITVAARSRDAANRMLDLAGVEAETIAWGVPLDGALVVNATPLGMRGEDVPAAVLGGASGLFDMAYGHEITPAVRFATGRIPCADGIDLLVAQAGRSFNLWTGLRAPLDAMEAAARR
jgi:shikimate dehydrogenase